MNKSGGRFQNVMRVCNAWDAPALNVSSKFVCGTDATSVANAAYIKLRTDLNSEYTDGITLSTKGSWVNGISRGRGYMWG